MNMVDSYGPDGSITYSQVGSVRIPDGNGGYVTAPRYSATQTLSDDQQQIYDQNQGAEINMSGIAQDQTAFLRDYLSNPINFDNLPEGGSLTTTGPLRTGFGTQRLQGATARLPQLQQQRGTAELRDSVSPQALSTMDGQTPNYRTSYVDDFSKDRARVEDGLNSRIDKMRSRDRETLDARLADQGIAVGSEAYTRAQEGFQGATDDLRLKAIQAGGAEQSRLAALAREQAQFGNGALAMAFDNALTRAGFNNNVSGQRFGQDLTAAQFGNDARQQDFINRAGVTAQNNQVAQQGYDNQMGRAAFNNDVVAANNDLAAREASFYNQAANDQFNQNSAVASYADSQRERARMEALQLRNQPLNEIGALLSGTQVALPQQIQSPQVGVATTDYAGIVGQNYQQQMQAYQAQMAQRNAMFGALGGIGAAFAGG